MWQNVNNKDYIRKNRDIIEALQASLFSLRGGRSTHNNKHRTNIDFIEDQNDDENIFSSSSSGFLVSSYSVKGVRTYMEDEYIVKNGGRFAAVFDGHGGKAVSQYLRQNLYANYLQFISKITTNKTNEQKKKVKKKKIHTPTLKDNIKALISAFRTVDEQVQKVSHWSYQGSTAVAVYLCENVIEEWNIQKHMDDKDDPNTYMEYDDSNDSLSQYDDMDSIIQDHNLDEDNDEQKPRQNSSPKLKKVLTLISLNVGDSRAILSRDGTAVALTIDHKPNHPSERRRIEKLGGQVTWCGLTDPATNKPIKNSGVYRMNGNLALSRAIGDRSERPWVSADADVKVLDLNIKERGGDEFIILGSDGLWDVMKSQDVVDFVHDFIGLDLEDEINDNQLEENDIERDDGDIISVHLSEKTKLDKIRMLKTAICKRKKANVARYITEEALRKGATDNISVIVIWLDKENDNLDFF